MNKSKDDQLFLLTWDTQGYNGVPYFSVDAGVRCFHLEESVGSSFQGIIFDFVDDYGTVYYPLDDLHRMGKEVIARVQSDPSFLKKLQEENEQRWLKAMEFSKKLNITALSDLTNEELVSHLKKADKAIHYSLDQTHVIEPFAWSTETLIQEKLKKVVPKNADPSKILALLTTPLKKTFTLEVEEDLASISKISDRKHQQSAIKKHCKHFRWLRNSYHGRETYDESCVEKELKSASTFTLPHFEEIHKEQTKLTKELGIDDDLARLLETSRFMPVLQAIRKKQTLIAIDYADRLLEEIGKRVSIKLELMRYLIPDEVTADLFRLNNLEALLRERKKGCVIITSPTTTAIFVGKKRQEALNKIKTLKKTSSNNKELIGISVSPGKAKGKASICLSIKDIKEFSDGDILVAHMTRPEYLLAMKRAAAIVTDEGGLTCHAAIVSRELGIPCVIATKTATKTIKNGDIISVDANNGKILMAQNNKR